MRVLHTSDSELADLAFSPFAAELLSDRDGLVVITAPDGHAPSGELTDRLSSIPCIVIAIDRAPGAPAPFADLVPEKEVASVDDVLRIVEGNPVAATSLALLLRDPKLLLGPGLVAESATYSMLQSGTEFATWRSVRPTHPHATTSDPAVRLERSGGHLEIVLDRPRVRNALNVEMRDGLLNALALAASDPTVTRVVLRGEGPSFCSGGDLNEFGSFTDPVSAHLVRLATSIGRSISALGGRLEVRLHGPCAGSGVELAAFAGHVTARPDFTATLPEVQLGLIPGAGGTVSITRRVGRHRMALLALGGSSIDATTALHWGLVDQLVPE